MPHSNPRYFSWILPFDTEQASLQIAGGKGANLSRLVKAGFPVPAGFLITTAAYKEYVDGNQLEKKILDSLMDVAIEDTDTLEFASNIIRESFFNAKVPEKMSIEILDAYRKLSGEIGSEMAVAVRSSATAEDLPDLSFAGQQDTYLNVIGAGNLLTAVVNCWSSLWTARAIGYRMRNNIPHEDVALAVVVQDMVESQSSGVLFTANPLSGLRTEIVIDATLGLGEALVSGQVEPDHYVVDSLDGKIISKTLGEKALSIHGKIEGGTEVIHHKERSIEALPDEQILALARLGQQVAAFYDFPQDIEWAWADNCLYLLQARPITSLFPIPESNSSNSLKVFFSFGAVQGMLEPMTPLGSDAIRELFAAGARMFGINVTRDTQTVLFDAAERLWVNFTVLLSNSVGRKMVPNILGMIEPTIQQAVEKILHEAPLQPGRTGISIRSRFRIARFVIPVVFNVLLNMLAPNRRREKIVERGEQDLRIVADYCEKIKGDRWQKLDLRTEILPGFAAKRFPRTFRLFVSGVAAGMASWNFLNMLSNGSAIKQGDTSPNPLHDLVLQVTRGMPYNPTTEMDLALWKMAQEIRQDEDSFSVFKSSQTNELSACYLAGDLPKVTIKVVSQFLKRYGARGLGEIDLGRKRWAQDPIYVFEMLASFLRIEDNEKAPDKVFARGAKSAQQAVDQLSREVRKQQHGWIKARLIHFLAGRARQLMGVRENPKFFAVRMMYLVQCEILKSGEEFVRAGDIDLADDLTFLTFSELKEFSARLEKDWRSLISGRRMAYQRELRRKQIPRLLLSDGRAFYEGVNEHENSGVNLTGSPVSPGIVEGRVRVVLNPTKAGLLQGEILVCPGTDPSWTPLFLSAGGLVMEVGGMMTHGAVVAREYGIPAIVGVGQATTRLHSGQLIRIDGSNGRIILLEDPIIDNSSQE